MSKGQALRKNGEEGKQEPRNEQEQLANVLGSADSNPLLDEANPGHGNYDDTLLWEQRDAYLKGLRVDTAMASVLIDRAIEKTKEALAKDGITFYHEGEMEAKQYAPLDESDVGEKQSRWAAERERGNEIWEDLGDANKPITEKQMVAMVKVTGLEPGQWLPIIWQYFVGVHEMSRSIDAELIRLYLGQSYSFRGNEDEREQAKQGILRRPRQ